MSNSNSGHNIHSLLDYTVSQALLSGKVGKVSISVPLSDLMNAGEGLKVSEEADDIVLKVEIKTSFDTGNIEIETEFEEDPTSEPY